VARKITVENALQYAETTCGINDMALANLLATRVYCWT